jgi:hypothetical protein
MGRVAGKGTFGQLTSILEMIEGHKVKRMALFITHVAVKKYHFIVKVCNKIKSLLSCEKVIDSCRFFLNIVTTEISQNMTEGTFSRGVPHILV